MGMTMSAEGRQIEVKRTYLELQNRESFKPVFLADERVTVCEVKNCPASFYRYLYAEVGRLYHWTDRLGWTDDELRAHLAQEALSLWVMYYEGAPAGYSELLKGEGGATELAYFGLLQEYLGRGLGKHLLSAAVARAWDDGAGRVWLHTCTLDDPAALPNYLKRGFQPFQEETYTTTISAVESLRVPL
jgi:GNAT superfamily N-acetyltransferase